MSNKDQTPISRIINYINSYTLKTVSTTCILIYQISETITTSNKNLTKFIVPATKEATNTAPNTQEIKTNISHFKLKNSVFTN